VAESSREFTTDEVRRHLTVTLPDFMIPARFVFLSRKLPRNMNGKIDRQTLKSHPLPGGAIGVHSVSLQQALVEIVAETLRLGSVSPDHTFLQLGGDSLLSIQVLMHFRQRFGAEIPIQLLLSSKTLADIATELGELPYVQ
ncbi:MAG TPA: phosphopantetheine-binding protein, partial [Terriglobia bacterium]|nr:phosphopantetheine-binding protein [Terriglobia bacterium]